MKRRPYIIIALILTMLATAGCDRILKRVGDYGPTDRVVKTQSKSEGMTDALVKPHDPDQGVFTPLSDVGQRALTAFTASLAALIVVISTLIPWLALLFFVGWGFIKLLRIYLRHKRAKKKNRN